MKPGDLVRFRVDHVPEEEFDKLKHALGVIISDETHRLDFSCDFRLFSVMFGSRAIGAFEYELELISEAR